MSYLRHYIPNPYLTPAAEPRTRAIGAEDVANNARIGAAEALDCGNVAQAVLSLRCAARAFLGAADFRAQAAALPGGTELDRRCVDWHRADAERCNAEADRLLYGDAAGADGGAQ